MPIRAMTEEDCAAFLKLDPIVFRNLDDPWKKEDFDYYFSSDLCFVSYDEQTNALNGYIFAKKQGNKIHISNIGVHPDHQRHKIGSTLMAWVISAAQKKYRDLELITLQVKETNLNAKEFYEKKFKFVEYKGAVPKGYVPMARMLNLALDLVQEPSKVEVTQVSKEAPLLPIIRLEEGNGEKPTVRLDVDAVNREVVRLRNNARSFFSIGNNAKADLIERKLKIALEKDVSDVRKDQEVINALAKHRIFSFFGTKTADALVNVNNSYLPIS
ncbi:GNAT family N-acetyltransferase [Legionella hackeliae]|uniref:N-acetyltransferase domain-containing protein n=1 Tax=Legionella hackeliae TaxID=449 RepID=A0A0A8UW79_LEGHA|nr:N-acetyltransferase [Legionella hackeliae]KTD15280.1 ribosomal-protein-alanine N-acetyltransferase [Legionella hackeliae]CEK11352.1 protein of unknown function [Legionella hackeliae]STX48124.1 ribosomal-protein-alanine N-acetyltransferase [Legionella hackeliae]